MWRLFVLGAQSSHQRLKFLHQSVLQPQCWLNLLVRARWQQCHGIMSRHHTQRNKGDYLCRFLFSYKIPIRLTYEVHWLKLSMLSPWKWNDQEVFWAGKDVWRWQPQCPWHTSVTRLWTGLPPRKMPTAAGSFRGYPWPQTSLCQGQAVSTR